MTLLRLLSSQERVGASRDAPERVCAFIPIVRRGPGFTCCRLVLVLALATGCSPSSARTDQPAHAVGVPALTIDAAKVELRDLDRYVEAVGTLDPNEEVTVTNQVEGMVEKIFVDLGDPVRQGQVVAQLDTRELQLAVTQQTAALQQELARLGLAGETAEVDEKATSQVRQAEIAFQEAGTHLDRARRLFQEGLIPKQQLEEQQARYDVAEAALRASRETVRNIRASIATRKAALDLARKKLTDARIVAPMSGFVKERLVADGQYLKSYSPVVTLVQNSPLKLRVEVPEAAVADVKAGRPVQFAVDTFPGKVFEGRISRLSPSVNQQSRTLRLEALVDNSAGLLKSGSFARVTIHTDRRDRALVAPARAVFAIAGLEKIFVIQDGKVAERVVRTGVHLDDQVELIEGVKEGELVATSSLGALQQGREVTVR